MFRSKEDDSRIIEMHNRLHHGPNYVPETVAYILGPRGEFMEVTDHVLDQENYRLLFSEDNRFRQNMKFRKGSKVSPVNGDQSLISGMTISRDGMKVVFVTQEGLDYILSNILLQPDSETLPMNDEAHAQNSIWPKMNRSSLGYTSHPGYAFKREFEPSVGIQNVTEGIESFLPEGADDQYAFGWDAEDMKLSKSGKRHGHANNSPSGNAIDTLDVVCTTADIRLRDLPHDTILSPRNRYTRLD